MLLGRHVSQEIVTVRFVGAEHVHELPGVQDIEKPVDVMLTKIPNGRLGILVGLKFRPAFAHVRRVDRRPPRLGMGARMDGQQTGRLRLPLGKAQSGRPYHGVGRL